MHTLQTWLELSSHLFDYLKELEKHNNHVKKSSTQPSLVAAHPPKAKILYKSLPKSLKRCTK